MNKIPVTNDCASPNSPSTSSNGSSARGLFGFLGTTLRTRLYDTFLKPPTFLHSPPITVSACQQQYKPNDDDHQVSDSDRGDSCDHPHTILSFPFCPPNTAVMESSQEMMIDELDDLEEKISGLENSMQNIQGQLQEPEVNYQESSPPANTPIQVVSFEDLDTLLTNPVENFKDKLPPSVYLELLALYESQKVNERIPPARDIGTVTIRPYVRYEDDVHVEGVGEREPNKNCKCIGNKEKNLRSEVLKWNKD